MFTELVDFFTLLATLPNRGVVLTEAAFVIVAFLFALELAAPLIALVGLILKASALPHARLNTGRALPRPPGPNKPQAAPEPQAMTPERENYERLVAEGRRLVVEPLLKRGAWTIAVCAESKYGADTLARFAKDTGVDLESLRSDMRMVAKHPVCGILVDAIDALADQYNELVDKYNKLLGEEDAAKHEGKRHYVQT